MQKRFTTNSLENFQASKLNKQQENAIIGGFLNADGLATFYSNWLSAINKFFPEQTQLKTRLQASLQARLNVQAECCGNGNGVT